MFSAEPHLLVFFSRTVQFVELGNRRYKYLHHLDTEMEVLMLKM